MKVKKKKPKMEKKTKVGTTGWDRCHTKKEKEHRMKLKDR
jgi:hypothetical protein